MKPFDHDFGSLLLPSLSLAAAYLLGCFNTGYYLVHWKSGQDLRALGSGNAGSKNVGRVLGSWGFGVSLFGDLLKGILAVLLAQLAGGGVATCLLAALAVTAGHNWPAQLGFRGGKGIACSFGALLVFDPLLAGAMAGLFAAFLMVTQGFTLSALAAYAFCPVVAVLCGRDDLFALLLVPLAVAVVGSHLCSLDEKPGRHPVASGS